MDGLDRNGEDGVVVELIVPKRDRSKMESSVDAFEREFGIEQKYSVQKEVYLSGGLHCESLLMSFSNAEEKLEDFIGYLKNKYDDAGWEIETSSVSNSQFGEFEAMKYIIQVS